MAAKITTNRDNGFAGAFVIVGPGGEIEETLILDGKPNVSAFWSLIATKSQIAIAEAEANQQAAQGGGLWVWGRTPGNVLLDTLIRPGNQGAILLIP